MMLQRNSSMTKIQKHHQEQHTKHSQQEQENLGEYTMERGKFLEQCDDCVIVGGDIGYYADLFYNVLTFQFCTLIHSMIEK